MNSVVDPGDGVCTAGECTLREAIVFANANPGPDFITFNIPGAGVHTITPATPLPTISDTVSIDGYTQPGASENTLAGGDDAVVLIELDGSTSGGSGLTISANDGSIRGLIVNRFSTGINLAGSNNVIEGNFIGTDAAGSSALANGTGVSLASADNNTIGGTVPGARNLIAGNGGAGLLINSASDDNLVQGNLIGTDLSGTIALENSSGVVVMGDRNIVGGTAPAAGNLVSGNDLAGVLLSVGATENLVQGNFIGTDVTGTAPLRNGETGVTIDASSSNTIGGLTAAARNIISVNPTGVLITNGATDNVVQGNYLGTDVTGFVDIGSDDIEGVLIEDSPANLIGGAEAGAGNLISTNFTNIEVQGAASIGNLIQGNLIGTDATGTAGLDFFGSGILLSDSSTGTTIGGPAGAGNVIAFNGRGVTVSSGSTGNNIFGNAIFANEGIGINLVGGSEDPTIGVTANDFPDSDAGPNNLQNYPVISGIAVEGENRSVEGSLTSNPSAAYVIDFYSNAEVDPSGFGEGEVWLGSLDVQTNAQSTVDFAFPLEAGARGRYITATATDANGNTSEFSLASEVVPSLSQFLNIATRLRVQSGENVLIGGFIVTGNDPKQVIIRAIGPSLGVAGPLADPLLELHPLNGPTVINDDWREDQEDEIIATGIPPTNDKESAIVATLDPGSYTAVVRGATGETGVGLVEIYDLSGPTDSDVANISTRGFVDTGDNVMIGGLIIGPDDAADSSILLRAIGPSLIDQGVLNALADPMLELRDNNANLVASNDDWKSTQQDDIEDTGAPPTDDKESAILATLPAGSYTAIVSGVGGTTGVGLVEAYHLE